VADVVRIATLGAARITPTALITPARHVPEVEVAAVAARDRTRAEAFARKHGVPRVHASYDALLADPDVDAIYNPLPNSLHAEWTIKALEAGKHVLCEKPFTSNAREAEEVAAAAERSGLVVMEAFHYRYHPLAEKMRDIVQSGRLGQLRRIEVWMHIPLPSRKDIRYQLALAGGATMDLGAYTVHIARLLAGAEPSVTAARAKLSSPGVDRHMSAHLSFPSGATGRIAHSLFGPLPLRIGARAIGSEGEMRVLNPVGPHYFHRLTVRTPSGRAREGVERGGSTYFHQLRAFAAAVLRGEPTHTPPSDSIATMRVIDAIYRAAGLEPRGTP
jgi:predicted dehydrogenase